jgi:endonuclease/exonuclease/phosphatase family metal-dependent hydrolase
MKTLFRTLFVPIFLCIGLLLRAQEPTDLKLISYNIWNGFEKHVERKDKFTQWIRKENPDIVALQELVDFKKADLQALSEGYGHQYSVLLKEKGYPVGISSRYPITVVKGFVDNFWHGMLHVKIRDLDIIVTHLSPFSWKYRQQEAQRIIQYVKDNGLEYCAIMGDLNSYSPFDAEWLEEKAALKENMLKWDKEHPEYGNLREGAFDYSVIATFLAHGFNDAIGQHVLPANQRVSFPSATLYDWRWGDNRLIPVSERLDYILLSAPLAPLLKNVSVHNGAELEGISDHYPVSATIAAWTK